MAKGPAFEREVCRDLSLWFSGGKDDNWYWRTSNSGGRMTVRGRKGKSTRSHCGDICAIDPAGQALLDVITWEVKRGYSGATPFDILDKPINGAEQEWEGWFSQARRSCKLAGTPYWMILARRDRRTAVVWMPQKLWADLQLSFMKGIAAMMLRIDGVTTCGMRLAEFFEHVTPDKVQELRRV